MIVAGFGFRRGTGMASFHQAYALTKGADALATVDDKAPDLAAFAMSLNVPLIAVAREALEDRPGNPRSRTLFGTGSLAESAALAAAGHGAILIQPRTKSPDGMVVIALAQGLIP